MFFTCFEVSAERKNVFASVNIYKVLLSLPEGGGFSTERVGDEIFVDCAYTKFAKGSIGSRLRGKEHNESCLFDMI